MNETEKMKISNLTDFSTEAGENEINLTSFFWMFVLMYPFNIGIVSLIYPNNFIYKTSILFGVFGIISTHFFESVRRKTPLTFPVLILSLISFFIMAFGTFFVSSKNINFGEFVFIFFPFIIMQSPRLVQSFWRVIKLFLFEHLSASYIYLLSRNFYRDHILTIIARADPQAQSIGAFKYGHNPGLSIHYSTNGIYLSIASLYFFSEFMSRKTKTNGILFALSFIVLLTTGKRAHPVFVMLGIAAVYFFSTQKHNIGGFLKKAVQGLLIAALGISLLLLLSNFFPEIMTFYNRFMATLRGNDFLNNRGYLYTWAIDLWKRNILFGNGWNSYRYYSGITADAHNVFLQLLCETGILGFLFFTGIMFFCMCVSLKNLHKDLRGYPSWIQAMTKFSAAYHMFFIFYCFTGNPLYDPQCYVIYYITLGFSLALQYDFSYFSRRFRKG